MFSLYDCQKEHHEIGHLSSLVIALQSGLVISCYIKLYLYFHSLLILYINGL